MSKVDFNNEIIDEIKNFISANNNKKLKETLKDIHYADIAELIDNLNIDEATYLIKLLKSDTTADALAEIDDEKREKILKNLSAKEIAEELTELDTDDAVDIISELPEERKERVISQIEDDKHIEDIRELLTYNENTAGGLMAKELVKVNENLSVLKCLNEMRSQAENVTRVHSIYVVDSKNKFITCFII